MRRRSAFVGAILILSCGSVTSTRSLPHFWTLQDIERRASRPYVNPHVDVECWVELQGPGFSKQVYGFWDGGDVSRVRVVATGPGEWRWRSGSNQPADDGLNGKTGGFTARDWTEAEKLQNTNRRGFLRPTANGHALQYADGTPFFLLGDTWLGAATWRLPLTDAPADANADVGPGVTFQQAVALRRRQGFNSVRMIAALPWKTYFDFNESYTRFLQYMVARYGAYTPILSTIHFDIFLPNYSLTAREFNEAITRHCRKYGPMPFGQPVASLIDRATDTTFGFSRAQMYGCVLSGGLAGHVHGTGAYDVTSAAEPPGPRPSFWQALRYASAEYMRGLGTFILSEGVRYRDLELASDDLFRRKAAGSSEAGLDGWSYRMRTPDRTLRLLYFKIKAQRGRTTGWRPNTRYQFTWFDPRVGEWRESVGLGSDAAGAMQLPVFPGGEDVAIADWGAKMLEQTSAGSLIGPGATLQKIAGGFEFTEGPTSDRNGNVFFTDQPNSRIMKWGVDGTLTTFLQPAGRANGMYFDNDGDLLACADEKTELWSIRPDGTHTVLASQFEGRPLNGPNDVWVRPDGALYFTDPFYARTWWDHSTRPQDSEQVYFLSADRHTLTRVTADLVRPNGIIGTPDGKTLFVSDIGAGKTWAFDIQPDGGLTNRRLRCEFGSDGMTLDAEGYLYLTGRGVSVIDSAGKLVEHIDVPEPWTANVSFGGPDHRTLFITASKGLYAVRLRVRGANAAK